VAVFTRKDSPWFWLWLEPSGELPGEKERTSIRADAPTPQQRKDNRDLAEQLYHVKMSARARGVIAPDAKPARTFAEQAAWFVEHQLPRRRGQEREGPLIPKLIAVFGRYPLAKITRTLVTELWITPRLTTPTVIAKAHRTAARRVQAGWQTVNREVAVLKAVLQSGVPDYLETSPLYGMPLLKGPSARRRVLTPDEERRLLKAFAPDDRAFFLIGHDALIRLTDILDVKWTDWDGDYLWIGDPKAGTGFRALLSTRARAALEAVPRTSSPYIFARRRRAETERDRRAGIQKMLRLACAVADVPYGRAKGGITFHWATRRTGATRMLTRGVDLGTVQKVGRWKTADIVLGIYHELTDEAHREAVEVVGRRGNRAGIGNAKRPDPTAQRPRATRRRGR
jgi:hypothetical protein